MGWPIKMPKDTKPRSLGKDVNSGDKAIREITDVAG